MGFVTDIQFVDTLANFYAHTPYISIVLDNGATCHRATHFSGLYVTLPPTRDFLGTWRVLRYGNGIEVSFRRDWQY